jgi:hypothetical protein
MPLPGFLPPPGLVYPAPVMAPFPGGGALAALGVFAPPGLLPRPPPPPPGLQAMQLPPGIAAVRPPSTR